MGRFVIAAFNPKPGMPVALRSVAEKHWRILHELDPVTDRPRYAMRTKGGTIL